MRHFLAVLAFVVTACASVPQRAPVVVADRLFCGMSIPGGGTVTQVDLDRFVDEVVEPRFPQGFTVWSARGEWKGGSEDVTIIEIVHAAEPALDAAMLEIGREYRRRFRQEAVLRVRSPAQLDFIEE